MAIQAQTYTDTSGFPMFIQPEWTGGGGVGVVGLRDETWLNHHHHHHHHPGLETKTCVETPSFLFSNSLSSRNEKRSLDIDRFILSQSERLRLVLREQRNRDVAALLRKLDTRASFLINQKDEEIAKAKSYSSQLEALLVQLQTDCLTWQHVAKQNELHVINLSNALNLVQQQSKEPAVEDSESCCDEQQSGLGRVNKMACRVCQRRKIGVVVLPCRHLCLCTVCDPMIDLCPVCQTERKASVEALFH